MRDTIDVILAGSSSVVLLTAQGECVGTSVSMDTVLQQGDNIISGIWQFGDGATASALSVEHTYSAPGSYEVEFIGTNAVGCQSYANMEVVIHALPTISFDSQGQCSNTPIALQAVTSSLDGAISTIDWLVDGQFYQGENITVDMSTPGWNNVIVAATTVFGCTAEWSQLYEIFSPPQVNAELDSVCHGSLSQCQWQLVTSGSAGSAVSVAWDFGDGTGSLQQQPFHFYTYPGTYDISLTTVNSAGCIDTTNLIGLVYANPEADFLITNFCEHEEKELIDMSVSDGEDPISQWLWNLDGTAEVQGQQPLVSFSGQGLHPVMLTVTTQHGCVGEVLQQIPVWPAPAVSFSWDPLISGAPWQVPFVANASLPCDFSWYFGDGSNGQGVSSPHLFGMNGTYNVQLTGTTSQGCSETVSQIVTVADPVIDVAVIGFQLTPAEEGSKIQVQLRNNGNIKLNEVMMSWQLGGNAPVIENWTIDLGAGESGVFDFASRVITLGAVYPYICVYAETSPWIATEQNLTDNAYCKPLETGGLELFSPYPNPGDDRMFVRLMAPQDGIMNMRVFDNKGQQVMLFEELDVSKGFQQFFIDISELTNGTYKMVAEMANAKSVVSFMKIAR
jgi:PKD repeat protein